MTRTRLETKQLNHALMSKGFGMLGNSGLISQLAMMVRDHDHFRDLLIVCQPEERRNMYEAMRPHLQFGAKPLDVYVAEGAANADRLKLPAIGPGGKLIPYSNYDPVSLESKAENAIKDSLATAKAGGRKLTVLCSKCTASSQFAGESMVAATMAARKAGWVYDPTTDKEICPKCPAVRLVQ